MGCGQFSLNWLEQSKPNFQDLFRLRERASLAKKKTKKKKKKKLKKKKKKTGTGNKNREAASLMGGNGYAWKQTDKLA